MNRRLWKRRCAAVLMLLALTCFVLGCRKQPPSDELLVFAAASMADALADVGREFEAETGQKVRLSLGASRDLARQIRAGAPAAVFVSADAETVDSLVLAKLVRSEDRRSFASNRLVVVVKKGAARAIGTPARLGRDRASRRRRSEARAGRELRQAVVGAGGRVDGSGASRRAVARRARRPGVGRNGTRRSRNRLPDRRRPFSSGSRSLMKCRRNEHLRSPTLPHVSRKPRRGRRSLSRLLDGIQSKGDLCSPRFRPLGFSPREILAPRAVRPHRRARKP